MLFELNPEILEEFERVAKLGYKPSQILRHLFQRFGEISPPLMADYFESVYRIARIDSLTILNVWWHDHTSDITDEQCDEKFQRLIEQAAYQRI